MSIRQVRICGCSEVCGEVINNWLVNLRRAICTCPVVSHDKKAGLKGETSNELTAGCEFEFNRVRPRS